MSTEREQELQEENARLRAEVTLLRQKVDLLVKRIFGASSEKLDARQLELLLEGSSPGKPCEPELAAEATRRSKEESTPSKSKPKGPRLPEHLPCVEEIVDPLPVQAEPEAWRYIGQETSEQLDYEPARFLRRRLIRRKYVKRGEVDAVPVIAPLPPVLQERCIAAPGLLAQVIVARYCDHLPFYRQEQIYATRHGVVLPRQTLGRWADLCADSLGLIYREINANVVGSGYIQMNDNQESQVLSVMEFEKEDGDKHKRARLTRFHDGGAYIEGAEEVIFEGREDSWRNAINYLEQRGYRRVMGVNESEDKKAK